MKFLVFVILLALLCLTSARQFDKCSLAREMDQRGVARDELPNWICLADHESHFDTMAKNKDNTDGSWDWGVYQLNDRYWCQAPDGRTSSNGCGINCSELENDDISVALQCAQQIKGEKGFEAWVAWNKYCQDGLPTVDDCF